MNQADFLAGLTGNEATPAGRVFIDAFNTVRLRKVSPLWGKVKERPFWPQYWYDGYIMLFIGSVALSGWDLPNELQFYKWNMEPDGWDCEGDYIS